ncbi:CDP-glycerol glycerophosphotransferase family protein [Photobacterium damselae]|uniref:CDP-glycerol glycerophosphotransferase family protein n=1 Tax=Photobacterium damselae TaxID=38293 RepID=UPI001EDF92E4|nr:CDP-glycerol glycerophosphotransferase family protein [Photobacterium damselae]MCG3817831.1 CDP-glycerol glycerophosphotransferase family protein [Photobacterium damselae]
MSKIKRLFLRVMYNILIFNSTTKDIKLFGSAFGFKDNSKYLFIEALNREIPNCYWIAKDLDEEMLLNKLGYPNARMYTLEWLLLVRASKISFFTHGISDISPALPKKTVKVNLWHGFPLKRMGYDAECDKKRLFLRKKIGLNTEYDSWDYMLASNYPAKEKLKSATKICDSKFIVTMQPRIQFCYYKPKDNLYKYVLYAPTFRDDGSQSHIFKLINMWRCIFYEHGIKLILKLHPKEEKLNVSSYEWVVESSSINELDDPQELIAISEYLISDYSSIIFDAINMSKKVLIFAPDQSEYLLNRGGDFYFDYSELLSKLVVFNDVKELNSIIGNYYHDNDVPSEFKEYIECDILDGFMK